MLARAKTIYDKFYERHCTSFGWVPENLLTAGRECSEMCGTADLLLSQILLAKAGYHKYWEHCEKFLRNHIAEAQFFPDETVRKIERKYVSSIPPNLDGDHVSFDDVLNRLTGGFAGPIYPDDMFCYYPKSRFNPNASRTIDISGCCSPSGIKAVATALLNVVSVSKTSLRVNILMDCSNDFILVKSFLPYQGRIEFMVKKNTELSVRVPSWCKNCEDIQCTKDGSPISAQLSDGYVKLGNPPPDSKIVLFFSLPECTEEVKVGGMSYLLSWRGYDVVSLSNMSDYQPLLLRYKDRATAPLLWYHFLRLIISSEMPPMEGIIVDSYQINSQLCDGN